MIFKWLLLSLIFFMVFAYHQASLAIWTLGFFLLLIFMINFHGWTVPVISVAILFLLIFGILNFSFIRRLLITKPLLNLYRRLMPTMSRTERESIAAGTISFEGELFRGHPDWQRLLSHPKAAMSAEEQAFMDGPVQTLCDLLNDWDITHHRFDLSPEVWQFIKDNGFFGLIIPKEYGGRQFSAYAHSQVVMKVGGVSITASTSISVPNSLGPAELLLHYGTPAQKNYYLPRLARGEEVPCFALTSPYAGSDASAMTDHGIICRGQFEGNDIIGIRLNFSKRYITLAPIATVIGLAFKLYDPDQLIGSVEDIGITCALIPRNTAGISIGRRHFPLNTAFQNGPIQGKEVFIPLDWIIGGREQAGKGWGMLMECLAAGRAISLPSTGIAGAKVATFTSGAYARIRSQFNLPIGKFEGIEEPLARMAAYTYLADATRTFATAAIDAGHKPAVASAIAKYHVTELARKVGLDAMDIQAGKGICLGPNNYLGRGYQAAPIAITVEGANILTRNMIIFGQGLMRCHPYLLEEMEAAKLTDVNDALIRFDRAFIKHLAFIISNLVRSFVLGITASYFVTVPKGKMKRYYQQATRFSSALAFMSEVCMATYGGQLKRKESISARLGDILSYLYMLSAALKLYHDQGEPTEDLPIVRYAALHCLFEIQERFDQLLKNFPNRWLAWLLKIIIFPLGERFSAPRDVIMHQAAELLISPNEARDRLIAGIYLPTATDHPLAYVVAALQKTIQSEPIEKIVKSAEKAGEITGLTLRELAHAAQAKGLLTKVQYDMLIEAEAARMHVIAVDDFSHEELFAQSSI